jgi:hypothetical protein
MSVFNVMGIRSRRALILHPPLLSINIVHVAAQMNKFLRRNLSKLIDFSKMK